MTEHTPFRFGNTGPEQIMILDANDNYVCSIQITQVGGGMIAAAMEPARRANAAFIVEACNSHDSLKAENERLREIAQGLNEWDRRVNVIDDDLEYLNSGGGWNDIQELAVRARAALAQKEGG